LLAACKTTTKLPEGAPPAVKEKELKADVAVRQNDFTKMRARFAGSFESEGESQDFRLEVRLYRDSLLWVDLADPFLGIKVARAVIYPDSVAVINRLDREYLTGTISDLQREFKIDLGFDELQALFSANAIFGLTKDFELYYRPGAYVLSDFNLDEQDDPASYSGKSQFRQVFLYPDILKPSEQLLNEPTAGKRYRVAFKDFSERSAVQYPEQILLEFLNQSSGSLKLELKSFSVEEENLNYPFNIPSSYELMR